MKTFSKHLVIYFCRKFEKLNVCRLNVEEVLLEWSHRDFVHRLKS